MARTQSTAQSACEIGATMQKIKLIKDTHGGNGLLKAGSVIEVSDTEAMLLEKAGYAQSKPPEAKKPKRR